jgi:hypothetical protein
MLKKVIETMIKRSLQSFSENGIVEINLQEQWILACHFQRCARQRSFKGLFFKREEIRIWQFLRMES